jgi:hypothetical protein
MNEINVVPYIDVMLVLLVIFMVTAPMIQTGSVDLPSVGKSSQPPVAPLEVIIKARQFAGAARPRQGRRGTGRDARRPRRPDQGSAGRQSAAGGADRRRRSVSTKRCWA